MMRWLVAAMLMTGGWMFFAGCATPQAERRTEEPMDLVRLQDRLHVLNEAGRTNEMIETMESALLEETLAPYRHHIFRAVLRLHIDAGAMETAQNIYVASLPDSAMASSGFGLIEQGLLQREDYAGMAVWTERLLASDAPEPLRDEIGYLNLTAYRLDGAMLKAVERVPGLVEIYTETAADRILRRFLEDLIAAGNEADLAVFLDVLDRVGLTRKTIARTAAIYRVKAYLAISRPAKAAQTFENRLASLSATGREGASLLVSVVRNGQKEGGAAMMDALCETILGANNVGIDLPREASLQSVRLALHLDMPVEILLARLQRAHEKPGNRISALLDLTRETMYTILDRGNAATRSGTVALMENILQSAENSYEKSRIVGLLLDALFLTENYDRAAELIANGDIEYDRAIRNMMMQKVKAHQAEKGEHYREAILRYRQFMVAIQEADRNLVEGQDPVTGLNVSREEVLGLNAERISRIWRKIGDNEQADAALAEARQYYGDALKRADKDSPEHKAIQDKIGNLHIAMPAPHS